MLRHTDTFINIKLAYIGFNLSLIKLLLIFDKPDIFKIYHVNFVLDLNLYQYSYRQYLFVSLEYLVMFDCPLQSKTKDF